MSWSSSPTYPHLFRADGSPAYWVICTGRPASEEAFIRKRPHPNRNFVRSCARLQPQPLDTSENAATARASACSHSLDERERPIRARGFFALPGVPQLANRFTEGDSDEGDSRQPRPAGRHRTRASPIQPITRQTLFGPMGGKQLGDRGDKAVGSETWPGIMLSGGNTLTRTGFDRPRRLLCDRRIEVCREAAMGPIV